MPRDRPFEYLVQQHTPLELDYMFLILEEFEPMILTHYEPVEEGYIGKKNNSNNRH